MAATLMGWAFLFAPTGAFTLEANVIFESYDKALNYALTDATAVVGKVITVTTGDKAGVYMIEAVGAEGKLKKVGSDIDLSNYVTKDQLTSIYTYKGTVATYEELLAKENPQTGDVWNVESEVVINKELDSETYLAGTNWVYNGEAWDALAGAIDLSGYATKSEVEEAINDVDGKVSTNTASISTIQGLITNLDNNKVDKVADYSLVHNDKIALIDTNANDIKELKEIDSAYLGRIQTLENLVGIQEDGTPGESASLEVRVSANESSISTLQTDNETNKTNISNLQTTVGDHGTRLANVESANAQQTTDISNLTNKVSGLETNHGNAISGLTTTVEGHTGLIADINSAINGLAIKSVASEEKVLAADASGVLSTTIKLGYDAENKKIQLKGISDAIVDELDASVFVKDGMLDKAEYDTATKEIVLTWNTDAGKEAMRIPMSSLVDTYTAGSGLKVENNEFAIKLDSNANNKLTVTENGLLVDISADITALESTMDSKINTAFSWIEVK